MSKKYIYICLSAVAIIVAIQLLNIATNADREQLPHPHTTHVVKQPSNNSETIKLINATEKALLAIDAELLLVSPDDRQSLDCKTMDCFITTAREGTDNKQLADLGWLLYRVGGAKNAELAIYWSKQSADQGNIDAQALLADIYFQGKGIPQDAGLAFKYAKSASDQGQLNGSYTLAWLTFSGLGTEKSETQSYKIYKMASDKGHTPSQSAIAWMYQTGRGVDKNIEEALKWYKLASDAGNHDAMVAAANLYYYGKETQKDEQRGLQLFKQAAAQGNAEAVDWIQKNSLN